jgi:hypothetical protein
MLLNELELQIQTLCEAFETRETARDEMSQRTIQQIKLSSLQEVAAANEKVKHLEEQIASLR